MPIVLFDPHLNLARSTVAVAPSTPTAGTSLTLSAGDGALFPATTLGAYNMIVWPAGVEPTRTNAEIFRVTTRTADVLSPIVRTQESSNTRSIIVGDQVALVPTVKTFTDIENSFVSWDPGLGTFLNITNTTTLTAAWNPAAHAANIYKTFDRLSHKAIYIYVNNTAGAVNFRIDHYWGGSGGSPLVDSFTISVPATTTYYVKAEVEIEITSGATQNITVRLEFYNATTGVLVSTRYILFNGTYNTVTGTSVLVSYVSMASASASLFIQGWQGLTVLQRGS